LKTNLRLGARPGGMTIGLIRVWDGQGQGPVVQGLMAVSSMDRRFRWIFVAGLSVLLIVVLAPPVGAGVSTWTSARLYGGTVYGLAASPANPSIVLAGTGGRWGVPQHRRRCQLAPFQQRHAA
jgi:hypothetical protein